MFFTCLCLALIIIIATVPAAFVSTPAKKYRLVIDAGHGGIDGGSVGIVTGKDEASINLEYSKCLKDYFENFDFDVILTRKNANGLYSSISSNKKKDDMRARQKIINEAKADIVISIHMNSFPTKSSRGCQVFYNDKSESGKMLAEKVQQQLIRDMDNAKSSPKAEDFFILNCSNTPSILVECGFLSNPEEDRLLSTEEYKMKLCYSIFCGVVSYFGAENI